MVRSFIVRIYAPEIALIEIPLRTGHAVFSFDGSQHPEGLIFQDLVCPSQEFLQHYGDESAAKRIGAESFWEHEVLRYQHELKPDHPSARVNVTVIVDKILVTYYPAWVPSPLTIEVDELLPKTLSRGDWLGRRNDILSLSPAERLQLRASKK